MRVKASLHSDTRKPDTLKPKVFNPTLTPANSPLTSQLHCFTRLLHRQAERVPPHQAACFSYKSLGLRASGYRSPSTAASSHTLLNRCSNGNVSLRVFCTRSRRRRRRRRHGSRQQHGSGLRPELKESLRKRGCVLVWPVAIPH